MQWLDLLELAVTVEEELDVSLPEHLLETVQTYGDLAALVFDRWQHPPGTATEPVLARAYITPPGTAEATLSRIVVLTPYAVETITADARRAGRGTHVRMTVPAPSSEPELAAVRWMFSELANNGIDVTVDRDHEWSQ